MNSRVVSWQTNKESFFLGSVSLRMCSKNRPIWIGSHSSRWALFSPDEIRIIFEKQCAPNLSISSKYRSQSKFGFISTAFRQSISSLNIPSQIPGIFSGFWAFFEFWRVAITRFSSGIQINLIFNIDIDIAVFENAILILILATSIYCCNIFLSNMLICIPGLA